MNWDLRCMLPLVPFIQLNQVTATLPTNQGRKGCIMRTASPLHCFQRLGPQSSFQPRLNPCVTGPHALVHQTDSLPFIII